MSEEAILILVFGIIGYAAAFLAGYCFCEFRRLAKDTGVCDNITRNLTDSSERVENLEDKLGGLVEAGRDVETILRKYSKSTSESKDVE